MSHVTPVMMEGDSKTCSYHTFRPDHVPCYFDFRAQGKTHASHLCVDAARMSNAGQLYVALSRSVSPDLITLVNLSPRSFVSPCDDVRQFLEGTYSVERVCFLNYLSMISTMFTVFYTWLFICILMSRFTCFSFVEEH